MNKIDAHRRAERGSVEEERKQRKKNPFICNQMRYQRGKKEREKKEEMRKKFCKRKRINGI